MADVMVSHPAPDQPELSFEQAQDLVARTKWYHRFSVREGLTTPGEIVFDAKATADSLKIPADLSGKRALDIGAWDGPLTFELERRGARAYALDIQNPTNVGFDTARRILRSKAVHYCGSVYQLPTGELEQLDLVAFRGVYYHLKYPLLAFERISAALKMGGTLHYEGEGLLNYAESLQGAEVQLDFAGFISKDVPVALLYPGVFKGASNWFVPSPPCLKAMMEAAGFKVVEMYAWQSEAKPYRGQRLYGYAVKIRENPALEEHPLY